MVSISRAISSVFGNTPEFESKVKTEEDADVPMDMVNVPEDDSSTEISCCSSVPA